MTDSRQRTPGVPPLPKRDPSQTMEMQAIRIRDVHDSMRTTVDEKLTDRGGAPEAVQKLRSLVMWTGQEPIRVKSSIVAHVKRLRAEGSIRLYADALAEICGTEFAAMASRASRGYVGVEFLRDIKPALKLVGILRKDTEDLKELLNVPTDYQGVLGVSRDNAYKIVLNSGVNETQMLLDAAYSMDSGEVLVYVNSRQQELSQWARAAIGTPEWMAAMRSALTDRLGLSDTDLDLVEKHLREIAGDCANLLKALEDLTKALRGDEPSRA